MLNPTRPAMNTPLPAEIPPALEFVTTRGHHWQIRPAAIRGWFRFQKIDPDGTPAAPSEMLAPAPFPHTDSAGYLAHHLNRRDHKLTAATVRALRAYCAPFETRITD